MIQKQENNLLFRRFLVIAGCNALMGFGLANVIASTQSDNTAFTVHKQITPVEETVELQTVEMPSYPYEVADLSGT